MAQKFAEIKSKIAVDLINTKCQKEHCEMFSSIEQHVRE